MKTVKKVIAVIPARGGSKGIPYKNIALVKGRPLLAFSVDAARNSKYITKTVVSSDDEKILSVAKDLNVTTLRRPASLATDTASTESAVENALEQLKAAGEQYDILVLLQPTSPLRTAKDIDATIDLLLHTDATAAISVYEPSHSPYKTFKLNNAGYLHGLVDNASPFLPRQQLPAAFMPNGAVYAIFVKNFLAMQSFFTEKTKPYVMTEMMSIDVDNPADLIAVEKLL